MSSNVPDAPAHPSFADATKVWAKIGLLGFGGPAGQIALMHRELVEERRWISETRFLHALNYCMLLPGPEAQQLATYVGWLLHGTRGGVVAGTLFFLPGFFVILALSTAYALFQETAWLASLFFGLKAAVLAIVVEAVLRVGRRAIRNSLSLGIAASAFLALFLFNVPFPLVVLGAGLIGYLGARARPDLFTAGARGKPAAAEPASLIDDDFAQIRPSAARAAGVIAVWGALWCAPLPLIVPAFGWSNIFTAIAGFFSQMSLVTFGGAYAVLAYVAQQAVEGFGWLDPGEMIDGLALAETTPGPLVLVLSYVGFLAAFRQPMGLDPLLAGVLGATLSTWVTFVPCFLWIFLGAPYVERLRGNERLSGALAAITAAVVGVILNLAIWFGLHVVFREVGTLTAGPLSLVAPVWSSLDLLALGFSVIAAVALFRLKLGILPVLALAAALGLAAGALGVAA
ncbi:MAG: chromate efflux transporter [Devosia sp.]